MKKITLLLFFVIFLLFFLLGCGKKTESPPKKTQEIPEVKVSEEKEGGDIKDDSLSQPEGKQKIRIQKIELTPTNPTVSSVFSVKANLSDQDSDDIQKRFVFWLNSDKVKEGEENTLPLKSFKKRDFIYADILILKNYEEVCRKRSKMVKILNSPPLIKRVEFPKIEGPGTYYIKVIAEDDDGDPIVFSTEGENIPDGVVIDSSSGVITYAIYETPPKEVKFFVVVKDDDQGISKQEIIIQFQKPEREAD